MPRIDLKCRCGQVKGRTETVDSRSGTRLVCCCDDCQSFARYLAQEKNVLDQYGGTDIFQMPVSHLVISQGIEQIACVRLSSKGLFRWYAQCCSTPIGNSMGQKVPFIGVVHNFMNNESTRDQDLGKIRGYVQTKFANMVIPSNIRGFSFAIIVRCLAKLMIWKIRGLEKPSVFFNSQGIPITNPEVLADSSTR